MIYKAECPFCKKNYDFDFDYIRQWEYELINQQKPLTVICEDCFINTN